MSFSSRATDGSIGPLILARTLPVEPGTKSTDTTNGNADHLRKDTPTDCSYQRCTNNFVPKENHHQRSDHSMTSLMDRQTGQARQQRENKHTSLPKNKTSEASCLTLNAMLSVVCPVCRRVMVHLADEPSEATDPSPSRVRTNCRADSGVTSSAYGGAAAIVAIAFCCFFLCVVFRDYKSFGGNKRRRHSSSTRRGFLPGFLASHLFPALRYQPSISRITSTNNRSRSAIGAIELV